MATLAFLALLVAALASSASSAAPALSRMSSATTFPTYAYDTPAQHAQARQELPAGTARSGSTITEPPAVATVRRGGPAARLAAEEGGAVLNFGSKAAARQGLDGDLGTAANRFFRDATSKSQDFQAQQLSGGGYRLQFFSPANNPGYGKHYVQEIDSAGNIISEFKNTMGPDGLIETKWVHGGP